MKDMMHIFSLFRMDMHRLVRSKTFYVMLILCIVFPVMMFTSMKENVGAAIDMLGPLERSAASSPLESMSGIGMLTIMTGIFLAIFIGTEYQTGSVKNIMTFHSDKKEYIISKAVIGMLATVCFTVLYVVALAVVGAVAGYPLEIPSAGGFILFIFERLLTSAAFTMMFVFFSVLFRRNYGFTIVCALVFGLGLVSMVLTMLAGLGNGIPFFEWVNRITVFGSGSYATLMPNGLNFLNVALAAVIWSVLYGLGSSLLLGKRDLL